MKITYDIIKENLREFENAKVKFPVLQKYLDGEASESAMRTLGLNSFITFNNFLTRCKESNQSPIIEGLTWKKLKPILIENTNVDRFKTYLKNRTENKFKEILLDEEVFSRLANGRWLRKPSRRSSGRRGGEKISSFSSHHISILNYAIKNELDVCKTIVENQNTHWYLNKLSLDDTFSREMVESDKILQKVSEFIDSTGTDFKKLNIDYLQQFFIEKFRKLVSIKESSTLKCIKTIYSASYPDQVILKEGKTYTVISSGTKSGYLYVWVVNDRGRQDSYPFSYFEDISFQRNSILDDLFKNEED